MATPTGQVRTLRNGVRLRREVTLKKVIKNARNKSMYISQVGNKFHVKDLHAKYDSDEKLKPKLGSFHLDIKGNERVNAER